MRELDGSKLANGLNKKLSSSRTSELNAQIDAEQKALAAEREKTLGDISNTKAVMKWEESPMRERYPNASLAATVASLPAAALLSRGIANKVTGGVEKAVGAANLARSERDPNKYVEAVQAAEGMATSAPYKTAAGATGAALLPPEIQAVPDLIDYKTMPKDSRAYQEAAGQFANPGAYVSGMAVPLIGGVAGSVTGVAKSAAMGSTARAEAQAMGAGMSGTYADDVKSAGRQFNRQHKADQSRLANDQTQDLTAAATQAVVRSLDDPATMTPQLARKLIAQQMAQGAPAASGTGRGTLSAFNASQQAEFEKALREKIARNP